MKIHEKFDELDISLYHLVFIGNSIETVVKAFSTIIDKTDKNTENVLYVSTFSIVIIQTVSFLNEYHNFLKSNDQELNDIIAAMKKAVKPAVDQINQWKEIGDFRNNALAHNLRDKTKMITVFEKGLSSYNIPKNGNDLMVLQNCISIVKKTFESAFRNKLQAFQIYLDNVQKTQKGNKFKNNNDAKAVIDRIVSQVNQNILKLKLETDV